MAETQLTVREKAESLRDYLGGDKAVERIEEALPQNLTRKMVTSQLMMLCSKTQALLDCTPASLLKGLIEASQLGLELTGPLGHCYLTPRRVSGKMEAVFQMGYRGLVTLVHRTGEISYFTARLVHEGDDFDVLYGTDHAIKHKPAGPGTVEALTGDDKKKVIAFYAVVKYRHGGHDFEVMSLPEMQEHRDKYSANKSPRGPWATHFNAMGLKTVAAKLARRCPLAPAVQNALVKDEEGQDWTPERRLPALPSPRPQSNIPLDDFDEAFPAEGSTQEDTQETA